MLASLYSANQAWTATWVPETETHTPDAEAVQRAWVGEGRIVVLHIENSSCCTSCLAANSNKCPLYGVLYSCLTFLIVILYVELVEGKKSPQISLDEVNEIHSL